MNSPAIIKQRRDTAANWTAVTAQPLYDGQLGLEIVKNAQNKLTSAKIKVGDGISTWAELPYLSIAALSDSTTSTQNGYFGDIYLWDDSTPSHYLQITNSANLTAGRSLSINVNDANRTVSLSGNLTVSGDATVTGSNSGDQTITLTGDVTGSGTGSFATTLANSGVTAGTYRSVTVDAKGRVTAGTNPTTLSGYGITDALSNSTTSTQAGYFGDIYLYDDSTPSHYLQITNSANLTAARILSINVNDASRTVSISGDLTVSSAATISGTNTGDQTITLTGDVTGSGTGSFAATIANSAVTYAKIQNVSTNKLLGRSTAGSGVVEEITCTSYARSILDDADAATVRSTLQLGDLATLNGVFTSNIGDLQVTTGKLAESAVTTSKILNNNVTYAKLAKMTSSQLLGTPFGAGAQDIQAIVLGSSLTISGLNNDTLDLTSTGIAPGTYKSVTVNSQGRVTAGTNPTTLSGYGITDALSNSTTSTQAGYFGDIYLYDDSTPSHYLQITNSANLTAARSLSINVNDANRTVSLSGNLTLANSFTTSGNFGLTLTTTNTTNATLPSGTGTLVFDTSPTFKTSLVTDSVSFTLFNTVATTINAFGNAETISIGKANTGTTTVNHNLTVTGNLIINGTTTASARSKFKAYWEDSSAPTISSGTLTIDLNAANTFNVSLNANVTTFTISNIPSGTGVTGFTLILTADGTARTITWPGTVKWAGGTAPTLTSTNGKVDVLSFVGVVNNGSVSSWLGFVGGQNF